jgi:hypothetical protein
MTDDKTAPVSQEAYQAVEDRYGWESILSKSFVLTDEIREEFENLGISIDFLLDVKEYRARPERDRALIELSKDLYSSWFRYISGSPHRRNAEAPHITGRSWRDIPIPNYWNDRSRTKRMNENLITVDDIEDHIKSRPDEFTPLSWPPVLIQKVSHTVTHEQVAKSVLRQLAFYLYLSWQHLLTTSEPPLHLLPGLGGVNWQDLPDDEKFWTEHKSKMDEYGITKDDVTQYLRKHPRDFPSFCSPLPPPKL